MFTLDCTDGGALQTTGNAELQYYIIGRNFFSAQLTL